MMLSPSPLWLVAIDSSPACLIFGVVAEYTSQVNCILKSLPPLACFHVDFTMSSTVDTVDTYLPALPRYIVRRYATDRGIYLSELSRKLTELKPNARVITVDKRLQGPFNLIS